MNRIETILGKSKFVSEPHLIITVDGVPLDELVNVVHPELELSGQVSALLGWFHNDADAALVWQRIMPEVGCTTYTPVLICPDDLDFSCGVLIAEVVAEPEAIRWDRFGLDATREGSVGSCIRWLPRLGPYCFSRADYEQCLAAFRQNQ